MSVAIASGAERKTVLVLHSYGYEAPGRPAYDLALARAFREATDVQVDLYLETIDAVRLGTRHADQTRAYLRAKYADRNIAVLVAVFDSALAFVLNGDDPLFPGVPVAAISLTREPTGTEHVSLIFSGNAIGQSAALAVTLHPRLRHIAIVSGATSSGAQEQVRRQIAAAGVTIPVSFVRAQDLEELRDELLALPDDAVVLLNRLAVVTGGQPMASEEAANEISRTAPVPTYVISDQFIGSGPVGGVVLRLETQTAELAHLALRVAAGATNIPPAETTLTPVFDWRQLQRWTIRDSALPKGSVVLFKRLNVWDQYKAYILAVTATLAVQTALLVGLLVQRTRRRRTELALRKSEQLYRASAEQNQDLAGRLIHAQEEERTRIARDLHDDVSQQVAGVSIMLSGLKRKVGKPGMEEALSTVQARTSTLADAIRSLSHQLHPSVLEHTGLVPTLKGQCAETARHHGISVAFSAQDGLEPIEPEVALCLFRIAQEALGNAVRHSQARSISVRLVRTPVGVALNVEDDGIGFQPLERNGSGLGLRSMQERARLGGGTLSLESGPGRGTSLSVEIPSSAVSPQSDA